MHAKLVAGAIVLMVFSGAEASGLVLAQDAQRGTTLVCYAGGGDGIGLEEWTPAQVADFEARFGEDVSVLAPHPETGGCTDMAGLMGGWVPSLPYRCKQDAEGRWYGPLWVYPWNRLGESALPDPETGRCPAPAATAEGRGPTELEKAAAVAVHLTELEAAGDYERLYAWMHPDARAVVPEAAVAGWYAEAFNPPVWMTVDDVRLVEWSWGVTGKVYPSAAEVAYRQRFADGEEVPGAIRLVRDRGVWRWFFGRDRAFVDEQIARFGAGA